MPAPQFYFCPNVCIQRILIIWRLDTEGYDPIIITQGASSVTSDSREAF